MIEMEMVFWSSAHLGATLGSVAVTILRPAVTKSLISAQLSR
ncbi:hypothetical protein ACWIGI_27610 [Nocardia sp. NPDC055321]